MAFSVLAAVFTQLNAIGQGTSTAVIQGFSIWREWSFPIASATETMFHNLIPGNRFYVEEP